MAQITSKNIALVDDAVELPQTKLSVFVHDCCEDHRDFAFSRHGQGNHVHCAVLSREITINGFGGACTDLCSDRGYEAALAAWREHKKTWEVSA